MLLLGSDLNSSSASCSRRKQTRSTASSTSSAQLVFSVTPSLKALCSLLPLTAVLIETAPVSMSVEGRQGATDLVGKSFEVKDKYSSMSGMEAGDPKMKGTTRLVTLIGE